MKKLFFLSILVISILSFSQDNGMDSFFDDGGISNAKNIVKFNAASAVVGDLAIGYERVLNQSLAIELGVGVLLAGYTQEIPYYLFDDVDSKVINPTGGYSYYFMPKYYYFYDAPETFYMGFLFRHRDYQLEIGDVKLNDYALIYGYQFTLHQRFMLDLSFGVGFRQVKDTNKPEFETNPIEFTMPIGIKLSYLF